MAFTGEGKLVRRATGYGLQNAEAALSGIGFAGCASRARGRHWSRSLAQATADGQCPELYFLKQERYVPNAHIPLAWTQANQALALHLVKKSAEVSR